MGRVVIGMDPHKRSATIEVLDDEEQPLMVGRFGLDVPAKLSARARVFSTCGVPEVGAWPAACADGGLAGCGMMALRSQAW
jgi:hypothetical protein